MTTTARQKNAVILSCNYSGRNQLYGCINDGNNIKKMLIERLGFDASNVKTLYDKQMTVQGIWSALDEMVAQSNTIAQSGKIPTMFLYYSGHGVLVADKNKDEGRGKSDGAIVPWDYGRSGFIIDDQLNARFIKKLNPATELFILPDCCYSGSNFDLEYTSITRELSKDEKLRVTVPKIIQLSGCRDDQTSAEVAGYGVATSAFINSTKKFSLPALTVAEFQKVMADVSTRTHKQQPQVSYSRPEMKEQPIFDWLIDNVGGQQVKQNSAAKQTPFFKLLQEVMQRVLKKRNPPA